MSGLNIRAGTPGQTVDVLNLYLTCAPMPLGRMYGYYLAEWEEGVRAEADLLDAPHKAAALDALARNDLETLSAMGFEDPLFFYTVVESCALASDEDPPKGGGFSCSS